MTRKLHGIFSIFMRPPYAASLATFFLLFPLPALAADNSDRPEVEIDGTAYQHVDPEAVRDRALPPVTLTPPAIVDWEDVLSRNIDPGADKTQAIDENAVAQSSKTFEEITAPMPPSQDLLQPAPVSLKTVKTEQAPPVQKTAEPEITAAQENIAPPKTMKIKTGVKAPVSKAVLFPIKSTANQKGEIDPSPLVAATTPVTPDPQPAKISKWERQADNDDVQQNPEILYHDVPLPKPRPNVTMASMDFVKKARRSYEETYTVIKRDGSRMPAIANAKVTSTSLPPARISVADIASDPLASQLVAMSPNDVAETLNNITPSAGAEPRQQSNEVRTGSRTRIVRENGNWLSRKDGPATPQQPVTASNNSGTQSSEPNAGRYEILFKADQTDINPDISKQIDSGIVSVLKANPTSRVQIFAYASATDGKEATARRISLARSLAMRSYLMAKGIDAGRMDVRAQGVPENAKDIQDRVDMILQVTQDKKS